MTDRDFDADDGRVLAEFVYDRLPEGHSPSSYRHDGGEFPVFTYEKDWGVYIYRESYDSTKFEPWSLEAPMWQIQSLLDAVMEKGLENEFQCILQKQNTKPLETFNTWDFISAPPSAVCRAILEMEVE